MTSCNDQKISLYLDGEMTLPDAVAMRRHLSECQSCAAEAQSLREINQILTSWGSQQVPLLPRTDARMRQRWVKPKFSPAFSLSKLVPAAVGTSAAALLLLVTANVGTLLHTQQPTGATAVAAENMRGLAGQSQPLSLARRASAIQDGHALAVPIQQRNKILFDES